MIQLYSAEVCPFAQRVRALLAHLEVPFRVLEVDLERPDPEFLKLTPTGKVPLLLDEQAKLYESQIINGYLADKHRHAAAFHQDPHLRARERLAMQQWDAVIVPAFFASLFDAARLDADALEEVTGELDEMLKTIYAVDKPKGSLLSFHCAPFWARMDWLRSDSPVPELVCERVQLRKWLDLAVAQPAVQATLPDRDATVQRYRERFARR